MKYLLGFLKILIYSFLLLCLVAVALNVFWRINNSSPQSPVYACGSFGDKVMKIEKKYLFLGIMHYQGINYWSPDFLKQHKTKGCADQVQGLGIEVRWPTMEPWRIIWDEKEKITVIINQRTLLSADQDRNFWDHKKILINQIQQVDKEIIAYSQLKEKSSWNNHLMTYEFYLNEYHRDRLNEFLPDRIYWTEYQGDKNKISMMIRCWDDNSSRCELSYHLPHMGDNTSYAIIYFHNDFLSSWVEVLDKSLVLINSSFQE